MIISKRNVFFVFLVVAFLILYISHHISNVKNKEMHMYNNMVFSLENDDIRSAKYHAKNIIKKNTMSIYNDIAIVFMYGLNKNLDVLNYKMNNKLFLDSVIQYEKSKKN